MADGEGTKRSQAPLVVDMQVVSEVSKSQDQPNKLASSLWPVTTTNSTSSIPITPSTCSRPAFMYGVDGDDDRHDAPQPAIDLTGRVSAKELSFSRPNELLLLLKKNYATGKPVEGDGIFLLRNGRQVVVTGKREEESTLIGIWDRVGDTNNVVELDCLDVDMFVVIRPLVQTEDGKVTEAVLMKKMSKEKVLDVRLRVEVMRIEMLGGSVKVMEGWNILGLRAIQGKNGVYCCGPVGNFVYGDTTFLAAGADSSCVALSGDRLWRTTGRESLEGEAEELGCMPQSVLPFDGKTVLARRKLGQPAHKLTEALWEHVGRYHYQDLGWFHVDADYENPFKMLASLSLTAAKFEALKQADQIIIVQADGTVSNVIWNAAKYALILEHYTGVEGDERRRLLSQLLPIGVPSSSLSTLSSSTRHHIAPALILPPATGLHAYHLFPFGVILFLILQLLKLKLHKR